MVTKAKKPVANDGPTTDYEVISRLDHDGATYEVGDTVALTEGQAAPLLGQAVKAAPAAA